MYSKGMSDVNVRAWIIRQRDVFSVDLWDRWLIEEPEFSAIIKKGRSLSEDWWNENGRANLKDKDFNYTGWYMNMKNRFGWADKNENKNSGDYNINIGWKSQ